MGINKIVSSFEEAVADVFDGAVILCGGMGGIGGTPWHLLRALTRRPVSNLTIVGNAPVMGWEAWRALASFMKIPDSFADASLLLQNGQVSKLVLSVPAMPTAKMREPWPLVKALQQGRRIEIEMVPQGTLAERIRAGRAGIPAFYTPIGVGTAVAEGKEVRVFDSREYLLEYAIKGDFSFIWAYRADRYGNLTYRGTSRSFNATMAGASTVTIAEVNEVVELGELDPEATVTPGIYVQRIAVRSRKTSTENGED